MRCATITNTEVVKKWHREQEDSRAKIVRTNISSAGIRCIFLIILAQPNAAPGTADRILRIFLASSFSFSCATNANSFTMKIQMNAAALAGDGYSAMVCILHTFCAPDPGMGK